MRHAVMVEIHVYMFGGLENDVILVDIYFFMFETLLIASRNCWEVYLRDENYAEVEKSCTVLFYAIVYGMKDLYSQNERR